jgi:hypothetical protein
MITTTAPDRREIARDLDRRIRAVGRKAFRVEAEASYLLHDMNVDRRFSVFDYPTINEYSFDVLGYGADKTTQLLRLVKRLAHFPIFKEAFDDGLIDWTKAKLVSVALEQQPEREAELVAKARTLTARGLKEYLGVKETERTFTVRLDKQQSAKLDERIRAIRQKNSSLSWNDAAALAVVEPAGDEKSRTVVYVCTSCGDAVRPTSDGVIPVDDAEVAKIVSGPKNQLLDIRNGPARMGRTPPLPVTNFVDARDMGQCQFPGCRHRTFTDVHHEGGWRNVGHDPKKMLTLCVGHHIGRHFEDFTIRFEADGPHFFRADGSEIR